MTNYFADAAAPRPSNPLFSWLLPSAAAIAAVVGVALMAAMTGSSHSTGDAATAPDIPAAGSITGASLANGERPFAYLEFDWGPTAGVPGFDSWQEPFRRVADASAR